MKKWYQSKAVWTGITGLVGALAAGLTGEMTTTDAIHLGFESLLGIFLRLGMLK